MSLNMLDSLRFVSFGGFELTHLTIIDHKIIEYLELEGTRDIEVQLLNRTGELQESCQAPERAVQMLLHLCHG